MIRGPVFKSLFLYFSYFPFALSVDLFACLETYGLNWQSYHLTWDFRQVA